MDSKPKVTTITSTRDHHHHQMANNTQTEEDECGGDHDQYKKKKMVSLGDHNHNYNYNHNHPGQGLALGPGCCQAERCGADLSEAKRYHRRHKVCELHSKSPVVPVAGLNQRFCQQCSRFHELSEFDEAKRSCRRRLAGHNERRRKSSVECYGPGEGSAAAAATGGKIITSKETQHHYNNNNINNMTLHQGNTTATSHYKHYAK